MALSFIAGGVIVGIFGTIIGFMVGRYVEAKLWLEDMLNNFAETEHLRNENAYLKTKLGITAYPWDEAKEETK